MAPVTPYTTSLGGREPIAAMRETAGRIKNLTAAWTLSDFERTHAAGKWTARQVLVHLAQTELALGTRARMALTTPDYHAQNFSQDDWLAHEETLSGRDACEAFLAMSRMNAEFFAALSARDRQIAFSHPEYGALTVDWVIHQMAGHQIHHLAQLEQAASTG